METFELERAAQAHQRRAAPCVQAVCAELSRREACERAAVRGRVEVEDLGTDGADDPLLHRARPPRLDQLPAQRPQKRLRHRADPRDTQPAQVRDRPAQHPIVLEAAEKLGVVVVEREQPAQTLDGFVAAAEDDRTIAQLRRSRLLVADHRAHDAVAEDARCVAETAGGQREGVGAGGTDPRRGHRSSGVWAVGWLRTA